MSRNTLRFWRLLRQVWMPEVGELAAVEKLLRNAALRDRSILEVALSRRFFSPFEHQEVVSGPRFEARSQWSRMALARLPAERIPQAAQRAFDVEVKPGLTANLLGTVRRVVVRATVELALGDATLVPLAQAAVMDLDCGIKMTGWRHLEPRQALADALEPLLSDPSRWIEGTYLSAAREAALALPVEERIDHMAAVFLGTGSIQVGDVVTHALIALAQHPEAALASDPDVIRETIRLFPVNASATRVPAEDVVVEGRKYLRGAPISFVPQRYAIPPNFDPTRTDKVEGWSFGVGPRSCPARKLASALSSCLLGHFRTLGVSIEPRYVHKRSLAMAVAARLGEGPPPPRTARRRRLLEHACYLGLCLETYPTTLVHALPELWRAVRE